MPNTAINRRYIILGTNVPPSQYTPLFLIYAVTGLVSNKRGVFLPEKK